MKRPSLSAVRWFVVSALALLLVTAPRADAQDNSGIDLTISPGERFSQRFQWLHWWDTQRPRLHREAFERGSDGWSEQSKSAVAEHREQLIAALVPIVKDADGDPYTRAGATIALARMGYEKLAEIIVSQEAPAPDTERLGPDGQSWPVGLVGDEDVRVRVAGWLALGVLDTEASRALLTDDFVWAVTTDDVIARLTAFGFLDKLSSAEREFLMQNMINSEVAEVQRMALWALSQHDSRENDKVIRAALTELKSPYSVAQAMLAKDSINRLRLHELMRQVIAEPDELTGMTVFADLGRGTQWQSSCTFGVQKELEVSALLSLTMIDPLTDKRRQRELSKSLRKTMMLHFELAAAYAANPELDAEARNDGFRGRPGQNANDSDTALFTKYQIGPAALALAMQSSQTTLTDDIAALEVLLSGESVETVRGQVQRERTTTSDGPCPYEVTETVTEPGYVTRTIRLREDPARGYAAVAMGLMLQRMNQSTTLGQERPLVTRSSGSHRNATGDLSRALTKAFENRHEPMGLRCGAAIAMGLSGMDTFRQTLREQLQELGSEDAALYGYITEALAMLGDPAVPELAKRYLESREQVRDDDDMLARRALASALIFNQHAFDQLDEVLQSAWPHDPWAGLALARTAAAKGDGRMIGYLLGELEGPRAAAAAISLSEVVDTQSPWRLSTLTEGINYTLDYRTPVELGWNPYDAEGQTPMPTRLVTGFDDPYFVHVALLQRLPTGSSVRDLVNDDSNGQGHFMFRPVRADDAVGEGDQDEPEKLADQDTP